MHTLSASGLPVMTAQVGKSYDRRLVAGFSPNKFFSDSSFSTGWFASIPVLDYNSSNPIPPPAPSQPHNARPSDPTPPAA